MNITEHLPSEFETLVVLGDIDGYLHVFSKQDDDVVLTLLQMAIDALENREYEESKRVLQ